MDVFSQESVDGGASCHFNEVPFGERLDIPPDLWFDDRTGIVLPLMSPLET